MHVGIWAYVQAKAGKRPSRAPIAQQPRDAESNDASMGMLMTLFPVQRVKK